MGTLVIPKTWSPTEIPSSADMNANFAAVVASANNIVNAQIAPTAAIAGTKLGALGTANFEDEAITGPKLAAGATTVAQSIDEATAQTTSITGTEAVVVSKATSQAGGGVLLVGSCIVEVDGDGAVNQIRGRLLKDGSPIGTAQTLLVQIPNSLDFAVQLMLARVIPPTVDVAVTWGLGVTRTSGTATMTATGWQLSVWELR